MRVCSCHPLSEAPRPRSPLQGETCPSPESNIPASLFREDRVSAPLSQVPIDVWCRSSPALESTPRAELESGSETTNSQTTFERGFGTALEVVTCVYVPLPSSKLQEQLPLSYTRGDLDHFIHWRRSVDDRSCDCRNYLSCAILTRRNLTHLYSRDPAVNGSPLDWSKVSMYCVRISNSGSSSFCVGVSFYVRYPAAAGF